jgi:type I restriction enzyme S subunit
MRGFSETGEYDEQFVVNDNDILIGMDDFNIAKWAGGEALLNQRVCKIARFHPS